MAGLNPHLEARTIKAVNFFGLEETFTTRQLRQMMRTRPYSSGSVPLTALRKMKCVEQIGGKGSETWQRIYDPLQHDYSQQLGYPVVGPDSRPGKCTACKFDLSGRSACAILTEYKQTRLPAFRKQFQARERRVYQL